MQEEELEALADLPDEQINTQDAPELSDWSEKKRGRVFSSSQATNYVTP